jgi:hypothetical protein
LLPSFPYSAKKFWPGACYSRIYIKTYQGNAAMAGTRASPAELLTYPTMDSEPMQTRLNSIPLVAGIIAQS